MSRLSGKNAVVTGAASGIGLAAITLFAKEGAQVMAIDRDAEALEKALQTSADDGAGKLAGKVVPFVADVTNEDQIAAAMAQAGDEFGGIDILVPNAGIFGEHAHIKDCPIDSFDQVMQVNVTGVVATMKWAVPQMIRPKPLRIAYHAMAVPAMVPAAAASLTTLFA